MIYGHGDDAYRYGDKIKMNFSSNVYSGADLTSLKEHLMAHFDVVSHYPEPQPQELEQLLADHLGVPENTVMVTNGANEAIYLIAQMYKGRASVIPQPTFNEYEDACKAFGHLISYDSSDDLELLPDDRLYWICNPNNPTGNVLLKSLLNHIIRQHPRYLYVVDQSYADYTLSPTLEPREMMDCYNVMLIHSLSKKYCIPGLRLGYIFSSPIIIDAKMIPDLEAYLSEASRLREELSTIEGLMVMDTGTNFMLVNMDFGETSELKKWLIDTYGILIRDASNFRGLDNHCFRVTARTKDDDDMLVEAIRQYKTWKKKEL